MKSTSETRSATASATRSPAKAASSTAGCSPSGIAWCNAPHVLRNRFEDIVVSSCGTGVLINNQHTRWVHLHVWGCAGDGVKDRGKNTQLVDPFLESNCGARVEV